MVLICNFRIIITIIYNYIKSSNNNFERIYNILYNVVNMEYTVNSREEIKWSQKLKK